MKSIRAKLIVFVGLPTLLIYIGILGSTFAYLRARSFVELEQSMTRLASNYAGRFDGYLREAAAVADTAAQAFSRMDTERTDDIYAQLRTNVASRPFIYGACAAFEPGTLRPEGELFAPYVYRSGGDLVSMNISRDVYNWYTDPQGAWYQEPKRAGKPMWSRPYFDEGAGNVLMITYSALFYMDGQFRGVATVDIDLQNLQETIGSRVTDGTEFMILAEDGTFVYDRRSERIMKATLSDIARENGNADLAEAARVMRAGVPGVAAAPGWNEPERQRLYFSPIPSTGWTFVAFTPERLALQGVRTRMVTVVVALAATLGTIILCIVLVSGRITRPLSTLTSKVQEIAGGNIDARVHGITSRDEIGHLATAFNTMASRLREHIDRLAEQEASRQKIEHDLSIARDIQRGLLPKGLPNLPGFEVAGWSQPADETGGDYYDWQPLPNGSLAVTLADVTGHGIGPALVTAVCRAYARASLPGEVDLGRAVDRINELLCEDLKSERFVTFVVAVIEPTENRLRLLSAGHGPLFYYEARSGEVRQYNAHDIPMGLAADITHGPPSEFHPEVGDALVLITDGFFEWADEQGEQYGIARLVEAIRSGRGLSAAAMIEHLVQDVRRYVGDATQDDDLTAVVLKRVAT